jgi:hypothetical protein
LQPKKLENTSGRGDFVCQCTKARFWSTQRRRLVGEDLQAKNEVHAVLLKAVDAVFQEKTFWPHDPSTNEVGQS